MRSARDSSTTRWPPSTWPAISVRWHLQHQSDEGTPLYAGTQLDRFGDTLVAIDDFNAPTIAVLDLDDGGQVPTVRWHRDPGTGFGDGVIADEHGFVAVTASDVRAWDATDGQRVARQVMDWHRDGPGAGGLEGRAFARVYLFEDSIVIERDRRWGPGGAIARVDAGGHVHAARADVVDTGSTYLPRLLLGESSLVAAVKRSDEPVWDLWALDPSELGW